jgi:hypothetical protein
LEGMNMIATNARTGHVAMFLRNPDKPQDLWVVEQQPPDGAQMHLAQEWFETMYNGSQDNCNEKRCCASIFPLNDEARAHFDERKVWDYWMKDLYKRPFVQVASLFSAMDSTNPDFYPKPLNLEFFYILAMIGDRFEKMKSFESEVFLEGLNRRLNTDFDSMTKIVIIFLF